MIYAIKKHRLAWDRSKAVCIFCGKPVSWGDYPYLCWEEGDKLIRIPLFFRIILPKVMVGIIIKFMKTKSKEKKK